MKLLHRTNILILLLSVVALSMFSVLIVSVAQSASCTGSSPVECTLSDAFSFLDSAPTVTLGKIVPTLSDSFHLSDSAPSLVLGINNLGTLTDSFLFSVSQFTIKISGSNVFVQQSTATGQTNFLLATNTTTGALTTELVFPIIFILVCIFIATKMGMVEFPILLGIIMFLVCGLIYAGILNTYVVLFPILFASVAMSLLVSKWLGSRGSSEG